MTDIVTTLQEAADLLEHKAMASAYSNPPRMLVYILDPEQAQNLARLLRATSFDVKAYDAINDRDPDNDGKTRVMYRDTVNDALNLARKILETKEAA